MPWFFRFRKALATGIWVVAALASCSVFLAPCDLKAAESREALLVWSCPPEEDVAGYAIHYGPVSRYAAGFIGYPNTLRLEEGDYLQSKGLVEYRLSGLDPYAPYWVSVTSYDRNENESSFSNEKELPVKVEAPAMGCQAVPTRMCNTAFTGIPGWILVLLGVPVWILWARRKATLCPHS